MYCNHCGKEIEDTAVFCPACGQKTGEPVTQVEKVTSTAYSDEEKACLDTFHRFIRYEHKSWFIGTIVWGVAAALFMLYALLGILVAVFGSFADDYAASASIAFGVTYAIVFFFVGVLYVVIAVINFIAAKKAKGYLDMVYDNTEEYLKRANSIGMIVFEYFFNEVAMAFFIVNFVRAKTNKNVLKGIIEKQK